MANTNLANAKTAKSDEFYTQYNDIQKEVNAYLEFDSDVFRGKTVLLPCDDPEWSNFTKFFAQNFEAFGLKKLISTSYAVESKRIKDWQPTLFETESPYYDADKSRTHGKIFVLDEDINGDGRFNINDLQWSYLKGDGDFRSDEVKALRDEADIIITNPPFSLFREFLSWIVEAGKKLLIIGKDGFNAQVIYDFVNASPYKEDVIFTGYLKDEDLPKYYAGAAIMLYLSFFEGFGLPVLEAMSCGTPVICSNTSCFPEIMEDLDVMVDPTDVIGIEQKILKILSNNVYRDELSDKCYEKSLKYSWAESAKSYYNAFKLFVK